MGPVISWLDGRGKRFDREFEEQMGEEYLVAHTGQQSEFDDAWGNCCVLSKSRLNCWRRPHRWASWAT